MPLDNVIINIYAKLLIDFLFMPDNQPILTISVAAKLLDLHPRTLMLYEQANLLTPHRTNTKRRLFSIEDINRLQFIKYLTRKQGLNLQGVKITLEAIKIAEENDVKLKQRLFPNFKLQRLI